MVEKVNPIDNIELPDSIKKGIDIDKMRQNRVSISSRSNIVKKAALRKIQLLTLDEIESSLECTFGPTASSTVIITGGDATTLVANYSKDGRKCLKHIMFSNPIELSIRTQLDDVVSHVDQEVGDGTTSATILSAEIFKRLCALEETNGKARYPYKVIRDFKKAVELIQNQIMTHKKECTIDDIYKIAYISTNGNEEIAGIIHDVYKEYGLDCFIETGISNSEENQVKIYDGLTIDTGYSDSAYINTPNGKSSIRNAHVYIFEDPIDTTEMVTFLDTIIKDNIFDPMMNNCPEDVVPTVIMAPKISRDLSQTITRLVEYLYNFDSARNIAGKPPILILTNLMTSIDQYLDIGRLCGAKNIKKYIDPKIQEQDIEKGLAPTPETVHEFAGLCEMVEADIGTSKFINPDKMFEKDENGFIKEDEDGNPVHTVVFNNLISFLESQIIDCQKDNADDLTIHRLKKRMQSLKANMIELNIGGITIADRDEAKDLVDDAVKSCRSAANIGVGCGANYEGFRACYELLCKKHEIEMSDEVKTMLKVIFEAYIAVERKLYGYVMDDETSIDIAVDSSLTLGCPKNIVTNDFDNSVLTSIDTDIKILDAISKIITLMFTTEQCYVQVPALNTYD